MSSFRRPALALAVTAAVTVGLGGALRPSPAAAADGDRQRAFAAASAEFGVPEDVLLAVSYLQSRWDTNGGQPSRAAGYGPMHLTDAVPFLTGSDHHDGAEDPRGDTARPLAPRRTEAGQVAAALRTVDLAKGLTGLDPVAIKADPGANIRAGAAVLRRYQSELGAPVVGDPAAWYGAVARYSGADDADGARSFADQVYATIRDGAQRTTDDGQRVTLPARAVRPETTWLDRLGLRASSRAETECPPTLACEWIPAPYQKLSADPGDYGNHDKADRPASQRIEYIVIHDTEEDYATTLRLVQDPTYVSWNFTLRSSDGHIAQHVKSRDVAWHAGNWYVNAKAIGLEHEGFAAQGTWYTEAMYRSSATLVRHLALRYGIPLDRHHILGHDTVQGTIPSTIPGMHADPGPYWDWAHYFDLLGAPLRPSGGAQSGLVTIAPDFQSNRPAYTGCDRPGSGNPCPSRPSASVVLRTEPRDDAPLLLDVGRHVPTGQSTMDVLDHGSRVSTGQRYAVAERGGEWTAVWYLGQKGWLRSAQTMPATGLVATPRAGRASVPVYGRAYPEARAYPSNVPVQSVVPLPYTLPAGQRYAVGLVLRPEYYYATTFDTADHLVVRGNDVYYQVQFGHRVAYLRAADVDLLPSS
ncbi:N-acetylmuramoyl-L-alanine amidase [Planosporangium mesophilum]|nr:N-acetylmuramoyl-L-alanine amidase [Planosporangium mesophilum]